MYSAVNLRRFAFTLTSRSPASRSRQRHHVRHRSCPVSPRSLVRTVISEGDLLGTQVGTEGMLEAVNVVGDEIKRLAALVTEFLDFRRALIR